MAENKKDGIIKIGGVERRKMPAGAHSSLSNGETEKRKIQVGTHPSLSKGRGKKLKNSKKIQVGVHPSVVLMTPRATS